MGKSSATSKRRKIVESDDEKKVKVESHHRLIRKEDGHFASKYIGLGPDLLTPEELAEKRARYFELLKIPEYEWICYVAVMNFMLEGSPWRMASKRCLPCAGINISSFTPMGFDVDVTPKIGLPPGSIYPLSYTPEELSSKFKDLADLAIQSLNNDNKKTEYEVVQIEKVNRTLNPPLP
ncbi:hypothetical protein OROGR_014372 [Orobanche gracilis]